MTLLFDIHVSNLYTRFTA